LVVSLEQLAALTRSWLASLETVDPDLYDEIAKEVIVGLAERKPELDAVLPAGREDVRQVLNTVDLAGKQIGEFCFAPAPRAGATVEEQLASGTTSTLKAMAWFLGRLVSTGWSQQPGTWPCCEATFVGLGDESRPSDLDGWLCAAILGVSPKDVRRLLLTFDRRLFRSRPLQP
jgi:hypothetical protein